MSTFRYYYLVFLLTPILIVRVFVYCGFGNTCTSLPVEEDEDSGILKDLRSQISKKVHRKLPSPHSEIFLGMTTGIDEFKRLPKFYKTLCNVGTVHVVVVSGFNITLVFSLVHKILGSLYRLRNIMLAQIIAILYSLFSGFDPPVVRALIMGSLVNWAKFYGNDIGVLRVLLLSAQVMIFFDPKFIFSLSFQLSFLSTLSLLLFSKTFSTFSIFAFGKEISDLVSTLAAIVLVWPIVSLKFGRVSLISPLVNLLVLWTVPIATVIGMLMIFLELIFDLPYVFWYPVFFLLDIFVRVCKYFDAIYFSSIDLQINKLEVFLYYLFIVVLVVWRGMKKCRKS